MGDPCPLSISEQKYSICVEDKSVSCTWGSNYKNCPIYNRVVISLSMRGIRESLIDVLGHQEILASHGVCSIRELETLCVGD